MAVRIRGIEGMRAGEVDFEIGRGARCVLSQYCISIIILTFRRASDIYFLRQGQSAVTKGIAIHAALARGGMVGHTLGTGLHYSIGLP